MTRKFDISRRQVLRGLAGATIALPLLEAMDGFFGKPSRADSPDGGSDAGMTADGARIKRFIGMLVPNGIVGLDWFPEHWTDANGDTMPPTENHFTLNPRTMSSLVPYQSDLIVFNGVHNMATRLAPAENHFQGTFSMLTGRPAIGSSNGPWSASGISLDQQIVTSSGTITKVGSLQLATEGDTLASISADKANQVRPPTTSPLAVFTSLFGDPSADPQAILKIQLRRKSILDRLGGDYDFLIKKIGKADKDRVQGHLDSIRDIEKRLLLTATCTWPLIDPYAKPPAPQDWTRLMLDLLVVAFQCDLTRAATLVFRHAGGGSSYFPWLPGLKDTGTLKENDPMYQSIYLNNEHHEMSHADVTQREKLCVIVNWFIEQLAYLVGKLKSTGDGAHSLLENTVVLQGSDVGLGNHNMDNIPFLLAGQGGGAIRTARYLDYREANTFSGVGHHQFLTSIMNGMGIPGTFGDSRLTGTPLDLS